MDNIRPHPCAPGIEASAVSGGGRDLLAQIAGQSLPPLVQALASVLDRVDDALFDFMQKSVPAQDQPGFMDAMRVLRRERAGIEQRFRDHLAGAFAALARRQPQLAERAYASQADGLSLVSEDDLDVQLSAKMLASSLQKDFGGVLAQLEQRLGWLAGNVELDGDSNPVGGAHLAAAVYVALRPCEVELAPRLILFKICERELPAGLEPAYDGLNRMLIEAGVLPQLRPVKARNAEPAQARDETPQEASPAADREASATVEPAPANATTPRVSSEQERALFSALHELLKNYRQNHYGAPAAPDPSARLLSARETLTVLSLLQGELPPGLRAAIEDPGQSLVQRIKSELVASASRIGCDPATTRLTPADEDAVDLVGMLFDVILDERELRAQVRSLIGRLIVPFIKVALLDRRMFLEKTHPARRLLNALAEACEGNTGETPQEKQLLGKVQEIVDRLIAEFNEDLAIFQTLEEEFRAFLDQHRKRVEAAERRAAEAQRGRERLEQARARAALELADRVGDRALTPTLDLLLRRYWTHHLSVVLLREGESGEAFRSALACADALVTAFDNAVEGVNVLPRLSSLRGGLEPVLLSSGCAGDAAAECLRALSEELRRLARGEEAIQEAAPIAISEPPPAPAPPAREEPATLLKLVSDRDALDYDPADAERIRQLAIGTWVEFVGENGEPQPAKYSWASPISGRLMFVNRRGMRVCVASAEELAAMMKRERLRVRPVNTAFERAMHQVLGRLHTPAPQPRPMRATA